ncbi:hypothetical protein AcV5_009909 [Taiwanofungus camphoratus]|nr:hypothetical protein AcV5_009909 [Antrodia cinnamomea]
MLPSSASVHLQFPLDPHHTPYQIVLAMPDTGVYLIQSYSYKEGYLRGGNQGSVDLVPVIVDAQPLANQFLIEKVPNKFTYYIRKSAAPPTGAQVAPSFTTVSDEALYLTTTPIGRSSGTLPTIIGRKHT